MKKENKKLSEDFDKIEKKNAILELKDLWWPYGSFHGGYLWIEDV